MKLFSSRRHFFLLLVATMMSRTLAAHGARLVRVGDENEAIPSIVATSSPSTTPSPWMHANTNMTQEGIIATEGCECTCDCSGVSPTPKFVTSILEKKPTIETSPHDNADADNPIDDEDADEKCSCSCKCEDPEHEAHAKMLHLQERAQAQRERRLNYERELRRQHGSMCDKNCPGVVKALKLWDAKKKCPLRIIKDGDVVCRHHRKVNLEAIVKSTCDESVEFRGSFGRQVENEVRYFQFGNYRGNIFGKRLRVGRYVVRTRVYSENNAQGVPGKETTFRFTVIECPKKYDECPEKRRGMSKHGTLKRRLEHEEDPDNEDEADEKNETGTIEHSDNDDDGDDDGNEDNETMISYRYHFVVAGLPGAGSSILLEAFRKHDEIAMGSQEMCDVTNDTLSDGKVEDSLDKMLDGLIQDSGGTKFGFNCPTAIFDHHTISRMEKHSPEVKFVVGLPHPILMLESLYNYGVSKAYGSEPVHEEIPSFIEVMTAQVPWKDVSLTGARFEIFLIQLAKMAMTTKDMMILAEPTGYHLAIHPNKFSVFLYTYEQLQDTDNARSAVFRKELQSFLGLSTAFPDLSLSDKSTNATTFPEFISICDSKWASFRANLLPQASDTAEWIINRFVKSHDVHLANLEHFSETLESWGEDPCTFVEKNDIDAEA